MISQRAFCQKSKTEKGHVSHQNLDLKKHTKTKYLLSQINFSLFQNDPEQHVVPPKLQTSKKKKPNKIEKKTTTTKRLKITQKFLKIKIILGI